LDSFACTPDLVTHAILCRDIAQWAAANNILTRLMSSWKLKLKGEVRSLNSQEFRIAQLAF
jgi:hypothetical protein